MLAKEAQHWPAKELRDLPRDVETGGEGERLTGSIERKRLITKEMSTTITKVLYKTNNNSTHKH